jgi:NUMOD4 motif
MEIYPYRNRELKNIKGEKWKDIPELEEYFQISNFG